LHPALCRRLHLISHGLARIFSVVRHSTFSAPPFWPFVL
jgi:hypothetical protein